MENTDVYIGPEPHIEVHKYYAGVVPVAVVLALVLQAFFPVHFRWASYLELPLLVTCTSRSASAIRRRDCCWAWSSGCSRTA